MNIEWINQKDNDSLIVFFSGWGGCKALVEHLDCGNYDVLFVDDYRTLHPIDHLNGYQDIYLIAWSFGVTSSQSWQQAHQISDTLFSKKIAINGSHTAIDRKLGIAPKVMQMTIDTLNRKSLALFHKRCGIPNICEGSLDINALKDELIIINERTTNTDSPTTLHWDKAIVSENDAIFTLVNLQRAWAEQNNLITLSQPHYPFKHWNCWQQIVDN